MAAYNTPLERALFWQRLSADAYRVSRKGREEGHELADVWQERAAGFYRFARQWADEVTPGDK